MHEYMSKLCLQLQTSTQKNRHSYESDSNSETSMAFFNGVHYIEVKGNYC